MPRDENGFLKADALRQGLREQFMVERHGVRHIVELLWDVYFYGGYAVRHTTAEASLDLNSSDHVLDRVSYPFKDDLSGAQRQFTILVRGLGGRA